MKNSTPAIQIKAKDLGRNAEALRALIRFLRPSQVRTILDVRYGLGGWAKELVARFPTALLIGFEADPSTAHAAWTGPTTQLVRLPFKGKGSLEGIFKIHDWVPDLVVADFNVATVKNRAELDDLLSAVHARWLIFTDVSCVKLHLNYRSYGLESASLEEYWARYPVPGYRYLRHAKRHHAASSALFVREDT